MENVIEASHVTKRYGPVTALDGATFEVRRGEIFAMLGPNGAGKSTAVEILEGLRSRDSGAVGVLGLDPATQTDALKRRIGVALQSSAFPGKARVSELIDLYARLYGKKPELRHWLERFELQSKIRSFYDDLSGGQKQKLALILAMINDPQLVFLDEPTNGLDAHTRRAVHDWLRELRFEGRTVFLTTHYIHEAEQLADRVAILARGRVIRMGPCESLSHGVTLPTEIRLRTSVPVPLDQLRSLEGVIDVERLPERDVILSRDSGTTVPALVHCLDQAGIRLVEIAVQPPTLEDLFLELTGESIGLSGDRETGETR